MSILTRGLGSNPIGLAAVSIQNGQRVPKFGPSNILTKGLGAVSAQTANYPYFNSTVMGFYSAPKSEVDTYDVTINNNPFSTQLTYGKVFLDANNKPLEVDRLRDSNGNFSDILSAIRPYRNYGTTFQTDPMRLDADESYNLRPIGAHRVAAAGDLNYASMTPDAHSVYNARSIQIIFPQHAVLGPRSVQRLEFFLRRTKELGVNLRMRKDKERVILELLDSTTNVKNLQQRIGDTFVDIDFSRDYDLITEQVYSGME